MYLYVALMRPMFTYEQINENAMIQRIERRFRLFCRLGPESYEYREELE